MSRTPTIRRATLDDVPSLLRLVEQYWRFECIAGFNPSRVGAPLRRVLSEDHLGAGWIAVHDGAPIGYLLAVYVFSLEHLGSTAEVDEFFVRPQFRAMGVGSKLLETAEATFVAAGCTNVSLQVGRSNDLGRAFYLQRGYALRQGYELFDKTFVTPEEVG